MGRVNTQLDGNFAHNPEPRSEHLSGLKSASEATRHYGADLPLIRMPTVSATVGTEALIFQKK